MHSFTDNFGRLWRVDLDDMILDRIREHAGVDLRLVRGVDTLLKDRRLLAVVLFHACLHPIRNPLCTFKEFTTAFEGPSMDRALAALVDQLAEFLGRGRASVLAVDHGEKPERRCFG